MEILLLFSTPTIAVIGYGTIKFVEYCTKEDHKKFESYLKRNLYVKKNIEKLINNYKSERNIKINIEAFYGELWILFNKPEKTRRLKGDFSIAFMIKKYLKDPSNENKNNLLKKMVQYHELGALLKKEKDGIPIISLLMVLLNLSRILSEDKKHFL